MASGHAVLVHLLLRAQAAETLAVTALWLTIWVREGYSFKVFSCVQRVKSSRGRCEGGELEEMARLARAGAPQRPLHWTLLHASRRGPLARGLPAPCNTHHRV